MAEPSTFGKAIVFMRDLGVYDVILPFLLIFTILFAILERTKVLGTEKIGEEHYTRKNLNAMVAFIVAFLVVASSRLVAIINEALANVMLLLLLVIFFVLLVGVFYEEGSGVMIEKTWKWIFSIVMFLGISAIFLWAIKINSNASGCREYPAGECPWLAFFWGWLIDHWNTEAVASIILIIVIIIFMYIITYERKPQSTGSNEK